jgi:hypothetical protein
MSLEKYPGQGAVWPAKQQTLCISMPFAASFKQFWCRSWKAEFTLWALHKDYVTLPSGCQSQLRNEVKKTEKPDAGAYPGLR